MAEKIKIEVSRVVPCSMQAFGSGCLDFSFERCWISISMLNRFADIWICLFGGELGIYMYREMKKHASFLSTPTIDLAPFRLFFFVA